ncbi:MAG TPA: hypothetical protein DCR14_14995 [Acidimicrobiaceae bacterium]|nr:hypothetical protein [Acidimicrobiaceae bacterium]
MIWVFIAVVVVAALALVVMTRGRGGRQESGVVSFRRHIDALSPEARREVHDRVRAQQQGKDRK